MIVCTISVLLLLPVVNFVIVTQKSAYKGMDRLDTLRQARIVIEKVQRDIKNYCYSNTVGMTIASDAAEFDIRFPVFPAGYTGSIYSGDENPVNTALYHFDREKKTLTRTLKVHPLLNSGFSGQPELLSASVGLFTVERKIMLGMTYYDIRVLILPGSTYAKNAPTNLHTSVRSDFESRIERHPNFITNRRSVINVPPP